MPIIASPVPATPSSLKAPSSKPTFFLAFMASSDPVTGLPWCPDVRDAQPVLDAAFKPENAPELVYVNVGLRPEWRQANNVYRAKWNVNNVPTLARFETVDGGVKETGRLVEGEILDSKLLREFMAGRK